MMQVALHHTDSVITFSMLPLFSVLNRVCLFTGGECTFAVCWPFCLSLPERHQTELHHIEGRVVRCHAVGACFRKAHSLVVILQKISLRRGKNFSG